MNQLTKLLGEIDVVGPAWLEKEGVLSHVHPRHGAKKTKALVGFVSPKRGRVAYVETGNFTKYEVNECNLDVATALLVKYCYGMLTTIGSASPAKSPASVRGWSCNS
jgi:hypothetical protein